MKNIEKYQNELENFENRSLVCFIAKEKVGLRCDVGECLKCEKEAFKWLLEEYEEPNPILTKEGKEFLRMMVADFNIYDIEYILKEEDENKVNNYLMINLRNGHVTTIYEKNSKECMLLKNMGNHQRYTAKELGLC